jgi:hypothetical protein
LPLDRLRLRLLRCDECRAYSSICRRNYVLICDKRACAVACSGLRSRAVTDGSQLPHPDPQLHAVRYAFDAAFQRMCEAKTDDALMAELSRPPGS